jgi:intracellular septation protein
MDKTQPHPMFKLATELGPLLVFFIANAKFHLFVATGAFMVAIVAAMIASYVVTRHVPLMALVTGVVVLVFGTLTLVRWALFFLAMAVLNEIIWRTQSTDFWVGFKAFGVIPLTMLFAITQMPLIKRFHIEPVSLQTSDAAEGDISRDTN